MPVKKFEAVRGRQVEGSKMKSLSLGSRFRSLRFMLIYVPGGDLMCQAQRCFWLLLLLK